MHLVNNGCGAFLDSGAAHGGVHVNAAVGAHFKGDDVPVSHLFPSDRHYSLTECFHAALAAARQRQPRSEGLHKIHRTQTTHAILKQS